MMAWGTSRPDVTCDTLSQCPITGKTDIFPRREALLGKNFGLIGADGPPTSQTASNQVGELSPIKPSLVASTRIASRKICEVSTPSFL